ncbi:hypothetical protein EBH_0010410 [Eimeria brunetti]|uniref:Uncharacterized protein n=1 Tax=Eimeria brunetti TaxID=51314 RepID=U6LBP9_9EIME|nr:hypothetical protein EBH_0010410 [Eimeria brunetti]
MAARTACASWRVLKTATVFAAASLLVLALLTSADSLAKTIEDGVQGASVGEDSGSPSEHPAPEAGVEARLKPLRKGLGILGLVSAVASTVVFLVILGHTEVRQTASELLWKERL